MHVMDWVTCKWFCVNEDDVHEYQDAELLSEDSLVMGI